MIEISGVDRITATTARITVFDGYEDGGQKRRKKTVNIPKRIQGKEDKVRDWLIAEKVRFENKVDRKEVGNRVMTVEKWAAIWLEEYIKPDRRIGTYDNHASNLRLHILPELGKVKLENLNPPKIKLFANKMAKKSNGRGGRLFPISVGNIRRTLSAMLETAVEQEIMVSNPAKKVTWISEGRKKGKALTPVEYKILYNAIQHEPLVWRTMFLLIMTMGMRRGEAVGLDWRSVDFKNEQVHIVQSAISTAKHRMIIGPTKTGAGVRSNYIQPDVLELLKRLKAEQKKRYAFYGKEWSQDYPVFLNEEILERIHPDSVTKRFEKLCKRIGLKMRLHDLRHSYVSAAIHQNAPITEIARQVGHASTDVTLRIYAHAFGNELESSKNVSNLVRQAYQNL
ncbi:MAG: site-specific integrase [Clostridia bacterium]|nr:site-specific integrase [Clostridia bacterium]